MDSKRQSSDLFFAIIGFIVIYSLTKSVFFAGALGALFIFVGRGIVAQLSGIGPYEDDKLNYTHEILALVSVILTKDKKILKSELNYVKRFLNHNFSENEAKEYLLKFREYTQKNLSIEKICVKLNYALDSSEKRQILHLIIGAAVADRELTQAELFDIYKIGKGLQLNKITVDSLLSMHSFNFTGEQQGGQQYQRQSGQQQYRRRTSSATSLSQAYSILEITPQATEQEIKKAYRKLAIIYHPDKVMNMGESHQKSAKEKFQKIQAAYEQVKAARGMN
ncbi:MAG: DnaJ domain-containing protein [Putridiphycobacter sp.]|nr:DnaJ domain-containing protein [Putridiphycobacter sp.]